jgi:hypothetical protein
MKTRIPVMLEPDQAAAVRELAHKQTMKTGKTVSLGQIVREAIDDYIRKEAPAP